MPKKIKHYESTNFKLRSKTRYARHSCQRRSRVKAMEVRACELFEDKDQLILAAHIAIEEAKVEEMAMQLKWLPMGEKREKLWNRMCRTRDWACAMRAYFQRRADWPEAYR